MTYTLYTKSNCPKCEQLKRKFQLNGTNFVEVSLDDPTQLYAFKVAYPTIRTAPVLFDEQGVRVRV